MPARGRGMSVDESALLQAIRDAGFRVDRTPRQTFGRGWNAGDVVEALRHFEGSKEALRELRDALVAFAMPPVVAEQRHLELLAAQLLPHVGSDAMQLARAIATCRQAAAIALIPGTLPLERGALRVLPDLAHPQEAQA